MRATTLPLSSPGVVVWADGRRKRIPYFSARRILPLPTQFFIGFGYVAEIAHRCPIAMFGSSAIPAHCFGIVLRYAVSVAIHFGKLILGGVIVLISGAPIPLHCFGVVLRYAVAVKVHEA